MISQNQDELSRKIGRLAVRVQNKSDRGQPFSDADLDRRDEAMRLVGELVAYQHMLFSVKLSKKALEMIKQDYELARTWL